MLATKCKPSETYFLIFITNKQTTDACGGLESVVSEMLLGWIHSAPVHLSLFYQVKRFQQQLFNHSLLLSYNILFNTLHSPKPPVKIILINFCRHTPVFERIISGHKLCHHHRHHMSATTFENLSLLSSRSFHIETVSIANL